MNGLDSLRGMMPYQAPQFEHMLRSAAAPAATTVALPADSGSESTTALTNFFTGRLQELSSSLVALRGFADSLRTHLQAMLGDTSSASAVASSASFSLRQRASFEFVTQEGDVVELTVRNRAAFSTSYASVQDASGSASVAETNIVSSSRLSIEVHGDLNDKELAAIKAVLTQVEGLADKFFGGDVQAAFAASSDLHIDSTQLASVAVEMSSRMRLRGSAASGSGANEATGNSTPPAPALEPAPAAAAAETPAAAPAAAPAPAPAPAAALPVSVQPAATFLGFALMQLQSVASFEMSMQTKLRLLVLAVMPPPTATAPASIAATQKLADSAAAVAA